MQHYSILILEFLLQFLNSKLKCYNVKKFSVIGSSYDSKSLVIILKSFLSIQYLRPKNISKHEITQTCLWLPPPIPPHNSHRVCTHLWGKEKWPAPNCKSKNGQPAPGSREEERKRSPHLPWQHQFSSVAQSCPTLCDPMDCSSPGLPVHHQLPEFTQIHVHWVSDAIQPSHPLLSPSLPTFNLSQHQGLFKWVSSSHQVAASKNQQHFYPQCGPISWAAPPSSGETRESERDRVSLVSLPFAKHGI